MGDLSSSIRRNRPTAAFIVHTCRWPSMHARKAQVMLREHATCKSPPENACPAQNVMLFETGPQFSGRWYCTGLVLVPFTVGGHTYLKLLETWEKCKLLAIGGPSGRSLIESRQNSHAPCDTRGGAHARG